MLGYTHSTKQYLYMLQWPIHQIFVTWMVTAYDNIYVHSFSPPANKMTRILSVDHIATSNEPPIKGLGFIFMPTMWWNMWILKSDCWWLVGLPMQLTDCFLVTFSGTWKGILGKHVCSGTAHMTPIFTWCVCTWWWRQDIRKLGNIEKI